MNSTQAPWLHAVTQLALVIHVVGGAVGLGSGVIAVCARKGGALHRKAGSVFVVSMGVMAVLACYPAIAAIGDAKLQFIPMSLIVYWLIRVRYTDWFERAMRLSIRTSAAAAE